MKLKGLLSFPLTPFSATDTVDLDVYERHLRAQIDAGPSGLFVACGTGEFTALSPAEYRQVVSCAVRVAGGRVPVVAGAGGGPRLAREFAVAAEHAGADGIMLLPPYLVESTPAGLVEHVRYVAAATGLSITIYQRANAVLDTDAAVALLDIDTVTGIKDGRGDVDAMLRLVTAVRTSGHPRSGDIGFLNGLPTAELSAHAYRAIGVDSYSSASLCFVPDIASAFYRAFATGDEALSRLLLAEFYLPFARLRGQVPGYAVSLVKAGARLAGLPMGPVRPPLVEPTPEHLRRLRDIIDAGREALASHPAKDAS
ncbi:5-dehydro-4-deoxyglucarate dehydratase [Stackebrandtia nassauensis]|uniref:Probable 5-dehydro-4-deoxyglucarate dehydratase n=1 Tax=Stackebrandtia nassauensis (strain DSM 44728 / CIP 108903 / NRRL B-16338 / NBRC 102104 / LLR-40K-21) TaxID=446470 RepID=D3Q7W2_STANL|nr:5-dehydro-4-deoxyglucarate dehydratase [Stackebrandtia nassauensis]ADD40467.1 dihydrodipicolinate synthetase [Stackebrandtia nassauensis DSM 44728]